MSDAASTEPLPLDIDLDAPYDRGSVDARFERGALRMARLEESVAILRGEVAENTGMTAEVHEVIVAIKSGLYALAKVGRGLAWCGRQLSLFFKWATPIVVGAAAIWHFVFGGDPPVKH
jgi:ABC-type uncharacterized transport system fused permease/ATPase subunit